MPILKIANLKALRVQRNLRQADVARALNIARETYSNYERGVREPDRATLLGLAKFYNVNIDYLTGTTEYARPYADYSSKERYICDQLPNLSETTLNYLVSVVAHDSGPVGMKVLTDDLG